MNPPAAILAYFPTAIAAGIWQFLPETTGLSGGRLWRSPLGWRLKAWPRHDVSAAHLRQTHLWLRHAAALDFVPRVLGTRTGDTVVIDGEGIWDIVTWMPGEPLLQEATPTRLHAAGRALAALHLMWRTAASRTGPCPAVERRLLALSRAPEANFAAARLTDAYRRHREASLEELMRHRFTDFALHPCLCDVRTEHVLFTGERVSGLIDFGAAQIDHPAADLARLLGDCVPGNRHAWQPLLEGYESLRPLAPREHELIGVLERAGAVASLVTWIERMRERALTEAEQGRVAKLLARCEQV